MRGYDGDVAARIAIDSAKGPSPTALTAVTLNVYHMPATKKAEDVGVTVNVMYPLVLPRKLNVVSPRP
jgi:hypothetical protein